MYTPIRDFYLVSPQNRKSSANTNTIKMDEEDAERDRLLSVMFYMVSNRLRRLRSRLLPSSSTWCSVLTKGHKGRPTMPKLL